MEDFLKDVHDLMNASKPVRLLMFSAFSLFMVVVLVVIELFIRAIREDNYLRKHYFQQWKLKRGTWRERRNVIIPDDPFFRKTTEQSNKVQRWILIVWVFVLITLSLFIVLY